METKIETPVGAAFGLGDVVAVIESGKVGNVIGWDVVHINGGEFEYTVQFVDYTVVYAEEELVFVGG